MESDNAAEIVSVMPVAPLEKERRIVATGQAAQDGKWTESESDTNRLAGGLARRVVWGEFHVQRGGRARRLNGSSVVSV